MRIRIAKIKNESMNEMIIMIVNLNEKRIKNNNLNEKENEIVCSMLIFV